MEEIWKDIIGYEGIYQISNLGRIRSVTRLVLNPRPRKLSGRILKTRLWGHNIKTQYHLISLSKSLGNGKFHRKGFLIHRLVLYAFTPNPKKLPLANHKDGDKFNNHVDNLEWCTHKENIQHAARLGLMGGVKCHNAKINSDQAKEIKILLSQSNRQCDIARKFNVHPRIIYYISAGISWKNV